MSDSTSAAQEITIDVPEGTLGGTLTLSRSPRGIVLFAHGSGSSRHSPRNRHVGSILNRAGLGTLLIRGLNQHDYPVVQACLLMLAMAVMLGTLIGDLAQAAMDPRVRSALQ